ncbi:MULTISPECIES: CBS domain-containing protein [Saccharibacillus]|uniref:CBS domain-containing protein n=1 Tax=Saccharibacillus brassicae TaxID=2583377 RepID=A0A4Y6V0G0_SACBS|nr:MULTISPECIES: CBS domain-containing protein [Saccharibacillus]MWJ33043.1 CBS domain-containing protein [Saccharibacillus sp. WB 17]QDH23542.1 CBS domain-containing protein [Saccharibacillus brassicae]
MEVSRFLLSKDKVKYIPSSATMMEAMDLLEENHYSAVPIIDEQGRYVGTLSEGDLLWKLKHTFNFDLSTMAEVPLSSIKLYRHNESVVIDADMEDMLTLAADQNFVPVTDHDGIFLGIIRRRDIINYYNDGIMD